MIKAMKGLCRKPVLCLPCYEAIYICEDCAAGKYKGVVLE